MGELVGLAHVRALIAAALVLGAVAAYAHEIGTTQVNVEFLRGGRYRIDVVTAPRPLLMKLEAKAGVPRSGDTTRIVKLAPHFAGTVAISFDGVRVKPTVEAILNEYSATMRLTGDIPRGAKTFTWGYGLSYSTYALQIRNQGDPGASRQWIDAGAASKPFPLAAHVLPPTRLEVIRQYLVLGFTHILPYGLDHILFVLGLFLLSRNVKAMLLQVTAFTIAHTITLGMTIYGLVSISPKIVEPLIALSIVYVAVENLFTSELKPWRVAIVFAFGLLHGMGFAGVLSELGLPRSEFLAALVSFNVGVEAGQLAVIAAAALLLAPSNWRERAAKPLSLAIAAMGAFWVVQRVFM
jgi:hypothetical protein